MSNYSQIIKIASVFFPKKVSNYISYKLFNKYRNEILEKSGYNKPNHFIRKLCLIANSEIHDEVVKDDISRWIENTFLYEYMAGKCLKSDHIYLVDEGFFHRIISIFSKDVSPEYVI